MPRKQNPDPISAQQQQDLVSEGIENFELPKSIVMKIAKSALPEEARLTKETVLSLVKGSTVFINYLAATAHDVAVSKQHKSIAASDVLKALELIEFGDLVEPFQVELQAYKDQSKPGKKSVGGSVSANGLKGFSISIPPAASTSGSTIRVPPQATSISAGPLKLKVKSSKGSVANGASASKGKARATVDEDGDENMEEGRGEEEEEEDEQEEEEEEDIEEPEDEETDHEESQQMPNIDGEEETSDNQADPPESPSVEHSSREP